MLQQFRDSLFRRSASGLSALEQMVEAAITELQREGVLTATLEVQAPLTPQVEQRIQEALKRRKI